VDYSTQALDLARRFFTVLKLKATYIHGDIFSLPQSLQSSFMISTSCGVAEHFLHKKRLMVLDAHFTVLKPGGVSYIMVPNKSNLPYFTYKTVAEKIGFWPWGEEYPYTRMEFEHYCCKRDFSAYGFFGDSFLWSLNYLNPFSLLGKKWKWFKRFNIPQTVPTPLDDRYAYSLGVWAKKT
jgi:SAM-dependent methyltransferase